MDMEETSPNRLYFGDNLDVLRERVGDESVDLIYLDPPFNSKATYNVMDIVEAKFSPVAFTAWWKCLGCGNDENLTIAVGLYTDDWDNE